jgi:hypothetical protein
MSLKKQVLMRLLFYVQARMQEQKKKKLLQQIFLPIKQLRGGEVSSLKIR